MTTPRISVIVGSLRRESFARKIAHEVLTMIPEGYEANIVETVSYTHLRAHETN